jgi:hypothetical protein
MRNIQKKKDKVKHLIDLEMRLMKMKQDPDTAEMIEKVRKMQIKAIDKLKD